jgi:hypothetical protein
VYFVLHKIQYVNLLSLAVSGSVVALFLPVLSGGQVWDLRAFLLASLPGLAGGVSAFLVLKCCLNASDDGRA